MSELIERKEKVFAPVIGFETELEIVAADGIWLTDPAGRRYLDFTCGISVTNLGHRNPTVSTAVREQLDRVWHAGAIFHFESLVTAAERLADVTPEGIEMFLFMNSGAEAIEASVKLARSVSGRQGIVVFRGGFHGRTMGAVTYTTSKAAYRRGYHPLLPSVFVSSFPHPFAWGTDEATATRRALEDLDRLFAHEVSADEVAAFLVEPVQGEGGYYPAGPVFLRELRRLADQHGILLIFDEIQTGFGRTGDWFASQVYGVEPDVLVLGKAMANGLPLSAVGASSDLMKRWPPGSHGTTFGGNPLACAAATATVDELHRFISEVPKLGDHAFTRFEELQALHPVIGDVRGLGLMIGVELVDESRGPNPEAFRRLQATALDQGLLLVSCGPHGNVIRFIPPLIVTMEELDRGIDIIAAAMAEK